uniref:Uncharacterized protein n=1 Tax=Oryza brachyantha TaxID=4533 RepID=J3N1T8_ORYBR
MAASSSSQADQNDGGPTWQPQEAKHRQRHLHRNLNVEVPVVASTGCFTGCFRPSPTSSSRCASPSGVNPPHADRPASPSPSLIKSSSAWIRARGQSFASS